MARLTPSVCRIWPRRGQKGGQKGVPNDQNVRCFGHPLQKAYRLLPPTLAKPKKGVFFGHFGMFWPFWPGVPKGVKMAKRAHMVSYYPLVWALSWPGCSGVLIGERGQKGSKGVKRAKTPLFTCRIMGIPGPVLARCAQMTQNDPK